MKILITGATGFVGRALIPAAMAGGHEVRAAIRVPEAAPDVPDTDVVSVGDLGATTDWRLALENVETVIHLAGRAHVLRETEGDPNAAYRRTNVEGTRRLAESAAAAGVRRLVFLSSIKVNGERTGARPFTEADPPAPENAYGGSKWAAEQTLSEIADRTGLETVILRAPLVYGPGVKGNFLSLLGLCARPVPLPLGGIANARSLLFVGNLVDVILRCAVQPEAAGRTFLVRDGEDVSTPDLVRLLSAALDRRAFLFPVPVGILRAAAMMIGKPGLAARLCDSLVVDDAKIRQQLGWQAPFDMLQGLHETAAWFRSRASRQRLQERR